MGHEENEMTKSKWKFVAIAAVTIIAMDLLFSVL
jgi:hypothetical protein